MLKAVKRAQPKQNSNSYIIILLETVELFEETIKLVPQEQENSCKVP